MVIFYSYVSLPEGNPETPSQCPNFHKKKAIQISAICISNPIPQGSAQQVKKS